MYILGINPGSHESSACLLENSLVISMAEEERFTRLKHATDQMPWHAIQYCLKQAGIELADVDYVATCWNSPYQSENTIHICTASEIEKHINYYRGQLFPASHFGRTKLPTVAHISHHLAHIAAVYRTSPFDEGAILIVDGQGDTVSTTLAHCVDRKISILSQYDISQSLGFFYQAVTNYLGFGWYGSEGMTMGLAPYGTPVYDFPEINLTSEGYRIESIKPDSKSGAKQLISYWLGQLERRFGDSRRAKRSYNLATGRIDKVLEIGEFEKNLAASAQAKIESVLVHLAQIALDRSGSTNLMLGGGVALNCSANEKLLKGTLAKELVFFPACGDSGAAIGAALELAHHLGVSSKALFSSPFLGPAFGNASVVEVLNEYGIQYQECDDPAHTAAERLADNQIVGWFQGRMEIGPRALGHRSILANPATTQTRDRVNRYVKRREPWRPFAPALLEAGTIPLLGTHTASPYMLRAITVPVETQSLIPGTIHVDGTARLQTVTVESDPLFCALISNLHAISAIPAVLNTSFNDENEPIVCSPHDAIKTYFSTGIDVLIINNLIIDAKQVNADR